MSMADHFQAGDQIVIRVHDWKRGEIRLRGRVIRCLSDTHVQVRLEGGLLLDGMMVAAPAADCALIEDERGAA